MTIISPGLKRAGEPIFKTSGMIRFDYTGSTFTNFGRQKVRIQLVILKMQICIYAR